MKPTAIKKDTALTVLQYLVFGGAVLYLGRALLIPLAYAALVSFVLYPVCRWLESKGVNRIGAILFSMLIIILAGAAAVALMVQQFTTFLHEWPVIKAKLLETLHDVSVFVSDYYDVPADRQQEIVNTLADKSSSSVLSLLRNAMLLSASSVVMLILIPVFSSLILYYRHIIIEGLGRLIPSEPKASITNLLLLTIRAYYNFIKGMIIVYLIVGILNSVGLLLLGVPHAIFFGFVASILTFIPYLGIMVGSLLPMAMAWITFDSAWYPVGVVLIFMFVQYLEANVIFPFAVSNRLNINALATLVAILAGGIVWGVSGMILFVPFVAIIKLIGDYHPKMRKYTRLIGTS